MKRFTCILALVSVAAQPPALAASKAGRQDQTVNESTWVDHDGRPIPMPGERDPGYYGHLFREAFVEQVAHAFDIPDKIIWVMGAFGVDKNPPAANINAFDEVPNSSWFTNRNHLRALAPSEVRSGAFGSIRPATPWTIKSVKKRGINPGFNIKDAEGKRWVVKLDRPLYPRLSSGAGVVVGRLLWAAGYNISHDEAVTFRRQDLKIDPDLMKGTDEDAPFPEAELDRLLALGAKGEDGSYYASASLFLSGKPLGPLSFRGKRGDDPNDRFTHQNRRELRGLYVVYGWLNNWDVKDHQSLDTFQTPEGDTLGSVTHNLLDVNASLGAAGQGPKAVSLGYEQKLDLGWTVKRFVTLGFAVEPWRRAHQKTGIPSVGNFEAAEFHSEKWRPSQYVEPFREMTDADGYWGAKLVASFSDAQVAAAIDAAGYEDPRARSYILKTLMERRDKVARTWFHRVAPLDFFHIEGDMLRFHDLAVDLDLESPRTYEVEARGDDGVLVTMDAPLRATEVRLGELGRNKSSLTLKLSIADKRAKPVRVEVERKGTRWIVTRVRHG